ncbi:DUF6911 family protein [Paraherbaspirillum soli]|uniref:DUF6911 family protein n=1 Tax=Paraherbaspirillum soli TaxID=631222 RepID=A0ABW0MGZ1_9BURK
MNMEFGGYINDVGAQRNQLPVIFNPDDLAIEKTVAAVCGEAGVVSMRCRPAPEIGPYELTLYVENGQFLLMLSENEEDGEHNVRTPIDNNVVADFVIIFGEKYPAKAITRDIEFVCMTFKEFAHTGNVSEGLLR